MAGQAPAEAVVKQHHLGTILSLLACVALAGGCRTPARPAGDPHLSPPAASSIHPSTSSFGALHRIITQPVALASAEADEVVACLHAKGFDPPRPELQVGRTANVPLFLSVHEATEHGYGEMPFTAVGIGSARFDEYRSSLSASELSRLENLLDDRSAPMVRITTPRGWVVSASSVGCRAQARINVYGSVQNWLISFAIPQEMNDLAADVYLDSSMVEPLRQYSACMADQGHPARFPEDAFEVVKELAKRAPRTAEARTLDNRIPLSDAHCQEKSNFQARYMAVFDRMATSWLTKNLDTVQHVHDIVTSSLDRLPEK